MNFQVSDFMNIIGPAAGALGGLIVGVIFQMLVHSRLIRLASKTRWKGDDVLVESIRGMLVVWFLLLGIYVGIRYAQLPPKTVSVIHKVIFAVTIFSFSLALAKFTSGIVKANFQSVESQFPSVTLFPNFLRMFILILGGLVVFQTLGISITPVLTALGVGGLAVALALQDTLSNMFAGIHITLSRQVRPGDFVKLDSGEEGTVIDINWRNTTIRKIRNNMVVIPNSKLASSVITNYNLPIKELTVLVPVGVAYDSDLEKVEKITLETARDILKTVPGAIADFEPLVRFHTFNDFSIDMNVVLRGKEYTDQYLIKHEFVKLLHKRFDKEGIEIPFPIRTVYMKNG